MKSIVLAFGTFDLLHPGHVAYLERAKALGNKLVVVVARDANVQRFKGKKPINSEQQRLRMVKALKPVDRAVLGYNANMFRIVRKIKPDVIALGYDQGMSVKHLKEQLALGGLEPRIVRLKAFRPNRYKSTKIRKKIARSA